MSHHKKHVRQVMPLAINALKINQSEQIKNNDRKCYIKSFKENTSKTEKVELWFFCPVIAKNMHTNLCSGREMLTKTQREQKETR